MTQAAEQCREYIEAEYPGVRISRQSCRDTVSGYISQHSAYQPGDYDSNALDIMGGPLGWSWEDNVELIQAVVDDLTPYIHEWSIRKIIWQVRDHFGHAHIDFYPMIDMARWCSTSNVTPPWEYSNGRIERHLDPEPENGAYNGEDDMTWADIVADETWTKAWEDGFITGDPALMPQYYWADGPATEDEKKNAYNVIMQNQMEATK